MTDLASTPTGFRPPLDDRVVLVTGGGSGIGRATCLAAAEAGARVAVCDIDEAAGQETLELLGESRGRFFGADVTEDSEVEALMRSCVGEMGALDGVHNNAGIAHDPAPLTEISEEAWDRVMRVNVRGAWLVLRHAIGHMRAHGRGAIVNTASIAGSFGYPQLGPYCVSKAGVIALTKVAAAENAAAGIRVNAVAPGMIATDMTVADSEAPLPAGPEPSRRFGAPSEVAAATCWLLADASSYVNGACLSVDGGWSTLSSAPRGRRPS